MPLLLNDSHIIIIVKKKDIAMSVTNILNETKKKGFINLNMYT